MFSRENSEVIEGDEWSDLHAIRERKTFLKNDKVEMKAGRIHVSVWVSSYF
jgi:hypothetical protein